MYQTPLQGATAQRFVTRSSEVFSLSPQNLQRKESTVRCHPHPKRTPLAPHQTRIDYKLLSLVFSSVSGNAPHYLSELIPSYTPARSLRSSSQSRLSIPGYHENTSKKRFGARSFKCAAPLLWNSLPPELKSSPSVESFRRCLKTHLFTQF